MHASLQLVYLRNLTRLQNCSIAQIIEWNILECNSSIKLHRKIMSSYKFLLFTT
jgi:hypothetical protein